MLLLTLVSVFEKYSGVPVNEPAICILLYVSKRQIIYCDQMGNFKASPMCAGVNGCSGVWMSLETMTAFIYTGRMRVLDRSDGYTRICDGFWLQVNRLGGEVKEMGIS